ncbi:MAG TPA: peptidoglycan DD-metalloendopeptidase family protein [Thermoanaerobaculia bacterium]|nr:peptidoglycan DD-metalloendopeptidase family protein [Thermoanaerobaculia bacterium]
MHRRPILAAPLTLALLASLLLVPTQPPTRAAEPPSREEELSAIRGEIARLEARLGEVRRREAGLAERLEMLEIELRLQEERLAEARAAGELAAARVEESREEVERREAALAAARDHLRRRLTGLYRLGGHGYLRLFLSLDPDREVLQGVRMLRFLALRDARAVEEHRAARAALTAERERLMARGREVARWVAAEEERRGELAAARARQAALLARTERERRQLAEQAGDLAEREQRLTRFLDLLAGRSGGGPEGTPMQELKGVLDPPVEGRLVAGYGPRRDPRYQTLVPHHGWTLAPRPGAEVRAVYAGTVLYSAPFQGYGPTVVVHHPGRMFSLYAGLARPAVAVGDTVGLGEPVGSAGETLYFEIRAENRPEDPAAWVR